VVFPSARFPEVNFVLYDAAASKFIWQKPSLAAVFHLTLCDSLDDRGEAA